MKTGGPFRLACGRDSDFYIDAKLALLTQGDFLAAATWQLFRLLAENYPSAWLAADDGGGVLLGATRMVFRRNSVWLRKPKDHGVQAGGVAGPRPGPEGADVVLLEDVVTTGAAVLKATARLGELGLSPVAVVTLVDRQEPGFDAAGELAAAGVSFHALLTREDILQES